MAISVEDFGEYMANQRYEDLAHDSKPLKHAWNDTTDGSLCGALASGKVPVGSEIRPWDDKVDCPGCLSLMSAVNRQAVPEPVERQSEEMIVTIKKRAKQFVEDNLKYPTEYEETLIESAMMIGALIAHGKKPLETYPATFNGKTVQVTIPED